MYSHRFPVVRNILSQKVGDWKDYEPFRNKLTPLGRALRKFQREYPWEDETTVLDVLRDIPSVKGNAYKPLVDYLARLDLHFGMMEEEMNSCASKEEAFCHSVNQQCVAEKRRQENTTAVLAMMSRPWLPSEQREGRLVREEDNCAGLQEKLVELGYTVTAVAGTGDFLVRLSPDRDPYQ